MSWSSSLRPWALQSSDGVYHELKGPNFFVGREDSLELTLKSRSVDKRHAVVTEDAVKKIYQLHDLGSLNGTFVNEVRIRQPINLKLGDKVRFGYDINVFRVEVFPKERSPQQPDPYILHNSSGAVDVNNNNNYGLGGLWHDTIKQTTPEDQIPADCPSTDSPTNQYATSHYIVSHQGHVHPEQQSYPVPSYSGSPPQFHHPPVFRSLPTPDQPTHCPCISCVHRGPFYPHTYGYQTPSPDHHGYQQYPHGFSHGITSVRPKLTQRPLSAHGDRYDTIVKGSPLYGQPPWWGWGSSDEEVYSYPNTSTIVAKDEHLSGVRTQHTIMLQNNNQMRKPKYNQNTHTVGSVSMVSKSKTARIGKTVKEQAEYVIVRKKSSLTRKNLTGESSPVLEKSSSADWEVVDSDRWQSGNELRIEDFDNRTTDGNLKMAPSFDAIPKLTELPEKPVSVKRTKERGTGDEIVRLKKNETEKKNRKVVSMPKGNAELHAGQRRNKGSADDTESDAESHNGCPVNSAVSSPPVTNVFGLTEVKLKENNRGEDRELSPHPGLPTWVQEWSRVDGRLSKSCDLTRDQTLAKLQTSSSTSTSSSSSLQDGNFTESKDRNDKTPSQPSTSTRPRSSPASGKTRSSPSGLIGRSHSVASTVISRQSPSKSSLARRSHTIAASISRSVVHGGGVAHSKHPHRSTSIQSQDSQGSQPSLTCSTSGDETDIESSDQGNRNTARSKGRGSTAEKEDLQQMSDHCRLRGKSPNRALPVPRGNKATMLRAEAVKGVKTKTHSDKNKAVKTRTLPSPMKKTQKRSEIVEDQTPITNNWMKDSQKISDDELKDDSVEKRVDEIFSAGRSASVSEFFKMERNDKLNRTFVLEESRSLSPSSSPDRSPCKECIDLAESESKMCDCRTPIAELPVVLSTNTTPQGKVVTPTSAPKPVPFAPLQSSSVPYVPSTENIKPFNPPCLSPDSKPDEPFSPRERPVSPESQVSAAPSSSPPPPSCPREEAIKKRRSLQRSVSSGLQSRRTWDVTDKPVEDLMLSSIHAFTVELRLASESVLSKVKKLYEGGDEKKEKKESDLHPGSKSSHESAIPDWKSSHAEIAGIFRNLRKVELSLRTMDQALSTLCKDDDSISSQTKQPMDLHQPKLNGQHWKDFKKKARKTSWALEHKEQFPDAAESEDDDDYT